MSIVSSRETKGLKKIICYKCKIDISKRAMYAKFGRYLCIACYKAG